MITQLESTKLKRPVILEYQAREPTGNTQLFIAQPEKTLCLIIFNPGHPGIIFPGLQALDEFAKSFFSLPPAKDIDSFSGNYFFRHGGRVVASADGGYIQRILGPARVLPDGGKPPGHSHETN